MTLGQMIEGLRLAMQVSLELEVDVMKSGTEIA